MVGKAESSEVTSIRNDLQNEIDRATDAESQLKEDLNNYQSNLAEIQDKYAIKINPVDDSRVIGSYGNGIATVTISGVALGSKSKPVFLIDGTYSYDGFSINIEYIPKPLGLVLGTDDDGNYYYIQCFSDGVSRFFKVDSNGAYTRIFDNGFIGSGIVKVSIDSFENGILKFSVYNKQNLVATYEQDLSDYIKQKKIGFIPYSSDKNIVIFPYKEKFIYKDFLSETILDVLLPKLVNKKEVYNIKLVGDSITAGLQGTGYDASKNGGGELIANDVYSNVKGHCWANSFKNYIESKFLGVSVKNYGISGATAEFINKYKKDIIRTEDDLVIIMIGTNNRNSLGDINRLYANLQSIINYCTEHNKEIILMSNIPASLTNENKQSVMHMEDVDMIVGSVAKINKLPWISVFKLMKNYLKNTGTSLDSILSDGLHPNDMGYDIMYYLITEAIGFSVPIENYTWTPTVLSV